MTMRWEDYIRMLIRDYGAVHFVAGHDHHFGHKNEGNPELLQAKCRELGLGCDIIPKVEIEGITVSSTYIRSLVQAGDMERAALFLGHPHCLSQTVGHGFPLRPHDRDSDGESDRAGACAGAGARGVYLPRDARRRAELRGRDERRHPPHRQRQRRRLRRDVSHRLRRRPLRPADPAGLLPPPAPGERSSTPSTPSAGRSSTTSTRPVHISRRKTNNQKESRVSSWIHGFF